MELPAVLRGLPRSRPSLEATGIAVAIVLGVCALMTGLVLRMDGGAQAIAAPSPVFGTVPTTVAPPACAAPVGLPYQDRWLRSFNGNDADQLLPMKPTGDSGPVPVKYVNKDLSVKAWAEMERAMKVWNTSPCVHLTTATACQPGDNCVLVSTADLSGAAGNARQAGGSFTPDDPVDGKHTSGGRLVFERAMVDDSPSVYLVAVHEMGHSLGLDHRSESSRSVMSVMNSPTGNPDRIDFDNLRVLYGR